jgi:hypothetical protein
MKKLYPAKYKSPRNGACFFHGGVEMPNQIDDIAAAITALKEALKIAVKKESVWY